MPRSRPVRFAALAAAAALLGGGVLASALPAAGAAAVRQTAVHRQIVWLPTGDAVAYDPAHPTNLRVITRAASGPGHAWRSLERDGHVYVFPLTAAPFLGTVLDPSLFDVTALAASGAPTIHASGTTPALPGLTVTSSSAGTQTGTFSHAGAKVFGAALQKAAVAASRRATATRTLFGASAIGTASSTVGPITPHFQQQTVIFKAVGTDGKPLADGQLFYGDTDDSARATGFAFIVDGEVRVSLPAGHFTLYGEADSVTDTGFDSRIIANPNLVVTGAANQVVPLDFRTATVRPSLTLPRPTTEQDLVLSYDREWDTGGFTGLYFGDPSGTVEFAPAAAPTLGTVALDTYYDSLGAGGSEYATSFSRSGAIPASLADRVAAGQLAAVHERIFDDGTPGQTLFGHGVTNPDGSGIGSAFPVTLPLDRTDYVFAAPGSTWNDSIYLDSTSDAPFGGEIDDSARVHAAGSTSTAEWLRQAIAPQIPRYSAADIAGGFVFAPASRVNGELAVVVVPFQDTSATGHFGFLFDQTTGDLYARTRLYRNGTLLDDEPGNAVDSVVPAGRSTYRVVADSTPGAAGYVLGSAATTTWTFASAAGSGGALPTGFECGLDGSGCRILPLLQVIAPLPTDLHGTVGLGAHAFALSVAPIQGAPASTTSATVQVSFDGGRTWTTQPVARHGRNCFRVTLTNLASAAGTTPTLRITGTDAAGGTVVQTVTAAYRVAAR